MSRPIRSALVVSAVLAAACAPAPTGTSIEVTPSEATTLEDLTVNIINPSIIARANGELTYLYEWSVDGALVSDLTEATVAAVRTRKDQAWTVRVTPFDGKSRGPTATAQARIINSAPEVLVTVSDNTPISTEAVQASVEFYDADNDPVEISYTWFRNGRRIPELQGPDLLPDQTRRGEVWRVQVVGNDGTVDGYTDHQDVLIQNGAPTVDSVELGPEVAFTLDDLTVVATASDPDKDPVEITYKWFIDGVERTAVRGDTLTFDRTKRGNVIQVEVTAADDELVSAPRLSNPVTIRNTPPGPASIALAPSAPTAEANIVCAVVGKPVDPDDDAMTYAFSWTRNGAAWTGPVSRTTHDGDTILAAYTALDDTWSCTVVPNDGEADGPPATASALVVSWTGAREFTNCGKSGQDGPSQSQCDTEYRSTTLKDDGVVVTAGIQAWEVPSSGRYRITAYGAQGWSGDTIRKGGKGAQVSGVFDLRGGEVLYIAVGQTGSIGSCNGGGGGGSWVVNEADSPLVVAGGGAGVRASASMDGCPGRITEYAGVGIVASSSSCAAKTTGLRQGGIVTSSSWGSAGGGFDTNGAGEYTADNGGRSWKNGLKGGGTSSYTAYGGFGAGGAGNGSCGGGGGGGYSGGDGGWVAGAGGSYNGGADKDDEAGVREGHGLVVIDIE
jgi:hypothetical protein